MGYGLLQTYGFFHRNTCPPSWWTRKSMGCKRLWVIRGMGYEGFDCRFKFVVQVCLMSDVYCMSYHSETQGRYTVPFQSIRPSRTAHLGGLVEIETMSRITGRFGAIFRVCEGSGSPRRKWHAPYKAGGRTQNFVYLVTGHPWPN